MALRAMRAVPSLRENGDDMYAYRKSTSIRHVEQCNQSFSNLICQKCDGSIKILLDVGNQQHAAQL